MNAPDTNILVYAHNPTGPLYGRAKTYLEEAIRGPEPFGIPILCVHGFIRVSTGIAFGPNRFSLAQAFDIVDEWLEAPSVRFLQPGERHWEILKELALEGQMAGPPFTDAVIAAIAMEHDAVLHTADQDFDRFPGLRWLNPFA